MEEIDIVDSIIGVASVGFRLSLILNAVTCEVANAPTEVHAISKAVTLYSLMLKQVGVGFQTADSCHSLEAVQTAKQIAEDSNRIFDEINETLDKVRTKAPEGAHQPSLQQRFRWCFRKTRIIYLLAHLESLKLSLALMVQILQLGRLMTASSKTTSSIDTKRNVAAIQQERVEAQNIIIIRHIQLDEVDRHYHNCNADMPLSLPPSPALEVDPRYLVEPPPEYRPEGGTARFPRHSLGDVDLIIANLRNSSKDMVRASDKAIDPLIERWTRYDVQKQREKGLASKVDADEDDEDIPYHRKYTGREESPRGYFLEGNTTDWRRPHSLAARQEYAQRRQRYAGYQASASAANSDDDSPDSSASRRRRTRRYVINSGSESSSESEPEGTEPLRRDSVMSGQASKPSSKAMPSLQRNSSSSAPSATMANVKVPLQEPLRAPHKGSMSAASQATTQSTSRPLFQTPTQVASQNQSRPALQIPQTQISSQSLSQTPIRPPPQQQSQTSVRGAANPAGRTLQPAFVPQTHPQASSHLLQRPCITPDQQAYHHSFSSPLPPAYTSNVLNPYPNSPTTPGQYYVPGPTRLSPQTQPQPRTYDRGPGDRVYNPAGNSSRPVSRDGRHARSPSRLSFETSPNDHSRPRDDKHDRYERYEKREDKDKRQRAKDKKHMRHSAAKGLIGAGAIAGFLEALEGLDL